MTAQRWGLACGLAGILLVSSGCVSAGKAKSLAAQNQSLTERNEALVAQLENLKIHSDNIADQLLRAEEEVKLLDAEAGVDRQRLDEYRKQGNGLAGLSLPAVAPHTQARIARISERYGNAAFAPAAGVSKLGTDILFDEGQDQLKPGAEGVLRELAKTLNSPDGDGLKVLLVGHTDDRQIARKPARDLFSDNFDLSVSRANQVARVLQQFGLASQRIGIAGYGANQPIAPNTSPEERQKNRRVEIFLMAQETPVIGWTESTPTLYQ